MSARLITADRIRVSGLRKSYGNTRALDGLDLDLAEGEVLGIAGPNGAGKSTLIRILAGEEIADSGEIVAEGSGWSSRDVAVVHQEPQLFGNLTVAENLLVGREGTRVRRPASSPSDLALMQALGIAGIASRRLGSCTLAAQQRTEIARALARNVRVFLFDEPNSALTDEESDELFREIHALAGAGKIVILVTHRLSDLARHAGRVAIVRDGRVTAILQGAELSEEAIARNMVQVATSDREAVVHAALSRAAEDRALVRVADWRHFGGVFGPLSFDVGSGEILALMGVEGSGARELLRSLAGVERARGNIAIARQSGAVAIRGNTAFVPATRQESLYSNLSVGDNLLVRLGRPDIAGVLLRRRRMRAIAQDAVRQFLVKARTVVQNIRSLSGGNQQKVAIAQAVLRRPKLLLLEEPTRGVDIGSRREIYRLLREFVQGGNAVVMFCTEVLEMFEAADRVLVVADGRLSPPLRVADHPHVEALATEVTKLERHRAGSPAAPA